MKLISKTSSCIRSSALTHSELHNIALELQDVKPCKMIGEGSTSSASKYVYDALAENTFKQTFILCVCHSSILTILSLLLLYYVVVTDIRNYKKIYDFPKTL